MIRVFADTFYFLALLNHSDKAHKRALAYTTSFKGEMFTTAWVLTELGDAMSAPANRMEYISTLNDLEASANVRIAGPDAASFQEGVKLFAARPDKEWSLTDCISFALMTREGITEALTGDHHFEQAGFMALLK